MGLLDGILKQLGGAQGGQAGGLGSLAEMIMKNPQLLSAAIAMLNPKDPSVGGGGGLADVVSAFNKGGLGDVMSSQGNALDGALGSLLGQLGRR
jgi:hypothetical protein